MGVKTATFYLNLETLKNKGNDKLKEFAKAEDLDVDSVIDIIYSEASKIGESKKIKVTFKMVDNDEDSFRIIVESVTMKYQGTTIYPYNKVQAQDFEYSLDPVLGKITLYNKKEECKKMSVTIDGVALDIFAMTYAKAKSFLKDISDRKIKNGYIDFPDAICFKLFGIKLNAKKEENGDLKVDAPVLSIDIYNEEEFFKEYYFEDEIEKEEEKYDVNIPLPDEYNYEKKTEVKKEETKKEVVVEIEPEVVEETAQEVQIEIPLEEIKEELKEEAKVENDADAELEKIRQRQDAELEKVKEKLKNELEQQLQNSLKKYDEENEKRENSEEEIEIVIDNNTIKFEEAKKEQENKTEEVKEVEEKEEEPKVEETIEIEIVEETRNQREIEELERLLEAQRKQQEALENRILQKLEELKAENKKQEEPKQDELKVQKKTPKIACFNIESYKGLKEKDTDKLVMFFGEDKTLVRNYLGEPVEQIEDDGMEFYDPIFTYYNENDRCTGIGVNNKEALKDKIELNFLDKNLITMSYGEIVKLIKDNDYRAMEDEDGIMSLKYGISIDPKSTDNFKDDICESIYIFKRDYGA